MRVFVFLLMFVVVLLILAYLDSNKTIYDHWYKGKPKTISLFDDEVYTKKLRASKNSSEEFFVLYDMQNRGIYCIEVEDVKKLFICTPMILATTMISDDDYLADVIKTSESRRGFIANIIYLNFIFFKKLIIRIAPLDLDCLADKVCSFERLDDYFSFNYEIIKGFYIAKEKAIK
ncbi:MAG: hypothetical protein LBR70_00725 [Lactobacillaceae bacterium]|nr:hypothetical protein [Lactobacillaceae bacterium]